MVTVIEGGEHCAGRKRTFVLKHNLFEFKFKIIKLKRKANEQIFILYNSCIEANSEQISVSASVHSLHGRRNT